MNVSLPTELEQLVHSTIASGAYASEQEVICAALYLFKEHTNYLKTELQRGIEQADTVEVLRILHGARNLKTIFDEP